MTTEQAKSELMQIYGMLSEEKKQALDVVMAQADGKYISKDTAIDDITTGLCEEVACSECPFDEPDIICKVRHWLKGLPSVAIPPEHDGCKDCVYQDNPQDAMPCRECKQNYIDKWKAIPSSEPKTGHWIDADGDNAICGCCNRLNHLYGTYCKHCGARMIELQEGSE